ncbi:MAG: hypothetical protein WCG78_02225 [Candidatus Omnitrophota bacterium]
MDIYIVRKCKIEIKDKPGSGGVMYQVPVMTEENIHSYIIKKNLDNVQREQIQAKLEKYYLNH